jgi:hypothetical protein
VPGTPKKPIPPVAPPKLEMPSTQWNWATVPDWPGLPTAGKAGRPSVRPGPTAGTGAQNGGSTNKRAVPRARIVTA